jgi:hypothetical protein
MPAGTAPFQLPGVDQFVSVPLAPVQRTVPPRAEVSISAVSAAKMHVPAIKLRGGLIRGLVQAAAGPELATRTFPGHKLSRQWLSYWHTFYHNPQPIGPMEKCNSVRFLCTRFSELCAGFLAAAALGRAPRDLRKRKEKVCRALTKRRYGRPATYPGAGLNRWPAENCVGCGARLRNSYRPSCRRATSCQFTTFQNAFR